ncbi:outer membrane protein assembly factor BamD [Gynuella sp.]|uniref:outer membrane protein assembly factor BamD n=1 Tax=Gynuella sp. TaxID=2969146 RepID=UPI003D122BB7
MKLLAFSKIPAILITTLIVSSCATRVVDEESLYQAAAKSMERKNYTTAMSKLKQMEDLYPFSRYAVQVQLDQIYATYKSRDLAEAVVLADRFVRLNPDDPQVEYAWYLRGLAAYDLSLKGTSIVNGNYPEARNPSAADMAFTYLDDFVFRFPKSEYAPDARYKMNIIRNRLARHELVVADFYLRRGAWVAAANRAVTVLEQYEGSTASADALAILATAYGEMDQPDLQQKTIAILQSNFPDHPSLNKGRFKPVR